MERMKLKELNMKSRAEVLIFLKKLWNNEEINCPLCDNKLELLHQKTKKDNCDYQCKNCNKKILTIHLLDELNDEFK